ncbi:MAG TPA: class I SAM-dependent methyltransferase [Xanthobacteraceae bacterium]|nr:class I SAM-dependent methyltransferase [Xanthobacteraceae bacterium]
MRAWVQFFDSAHTIYVNARHRDVHFRRIAEDIAPYVPSRTATVLDFGCGEALHADVVAEAAGHLILAEAAPGVRARIAERFRDVSRIEARSTDDVAGMPDGSIDLLVMHSVSQYLTSDQLDGLLRTFRRLLKPGGTLLLGDVVPPYVSPMVDALALLRFGAREGFLGAALVGLLRTVFSDYRRLRSSMGLARYDETTILHKLAAAGFAAKRAAANLGHNPARMTFIATPRPADGEALAAE